MVRSRLGALRQLSNSDGTKRLLAERDAAAVAMRVTVGAWGLGPRGWLGVLVHAGS